MKKTFVQENTYLLKNKCVTLASNVLIIMTLSEYLVCYNLTYSSQQVICRLILVGSVELKIVF